MSSDSTRDILPEPSDQLKQLSARLQSRIVHRIDQHGPIPFSRFMEMALYEPGLGYYSAGLRKFGPGGDFITAPELGSVFARCLAAQVGEIAARLGDYSIFEVGAGTGRLAADLLTALENSAPPSRYLILERSADLRMLQTETLHAARPDWSDRIEWLDEPPGEKWQGVLLANEVVDALPVELFRLRSGQVLQVKVTHENGRLAWTTDEAPISLSARVRESLGGGLEQLGDYQSEICTMLRPWLDGLSEGLEKGCALFIDYGYPRAEYYSVERSMGTLICHYRHRAHDDPLALPGLQDISAFVDFTALAEAGTCCGMDLGGYTNLTAFLLACGLENLQPELERASERERLELVAEIRRLTLPGAMGEKFQVMAFGRGLEAPLRGFGVLDLSHRL